MTSTTLTPTGKTPTFQKTPGYSWWVLTSSMLCFMCFFIGLNTVSVFGTLIMSEWNISATQLSFLTTGSMITFCFVPLFVGPLVSKLSMKAVVTLGMMCNIVSGLLVPVIGDAYGPLLALRFLQGCCGGFMNAALAANLSLYFPKVQRGLATGIFMGFLGVGFSVTAFLGARMLNMGMTWQMANMWMAVVPSVICLLLFLFTVKDFRKVYNAESIDELMPAPDESKKSKRFAHLQSPKSYADLFRSSRAWNCGLYGCCTAVVLYGLGYALPIWLEQGRGLDLVTVGAVTGATFLFKLVAAPIGGFMSDKIFKGDRYQTMMIGAALAGILVALLPFVGTSILTPFLCVMFTAASLYGGTYWTWPADLAPEALYEASGFFVFTGNIGAVIVAPMLGAVLDATGNPDIMLYVIAAFSLVSIIFGKFSKI